MARRDSLEVITSAMFDPEAEAKLSSADKALLLRAKDGYTYWLDHPQLSERQIREYIIAIHKISKTQALLDIRILTTLLGNVNNSSKEFYRYKVNDLLSKATAAANAGFDKKAKALAKIADVMVKNNRTDHDDGETLPLDQIIIPDLSFSIDPTVAGVKVLPGAIATAKKLEAKILQELGIDIEVIEDGD